MARSVLIATEDSGLYAVLSAEIEALGFEVHWATDGHDALEIALGESPCVVFTDVTLAVFNGMELCEHLRADPLVPRELPIYLLSDDALEPHALERVGVTGVFPKTHGGDALRELVVSAAEAVPELPAD